MKKFYDLVQGKYLICNAGLTKNNLASFSRHFFSSNTDTKFNP